MARGALILAHLSRKRARSAAKGLCVGGKASAQATAQESGFFAVVNQPAASVEFAHTQSLAKATERGALFEESLRDRRRT